MTLSQRRVQYETAGLDRADLADDPITEWRAWYEQAVEAGVAEPNAMTLATVDGDGNPDARVLLARGADERGLVFYSNYDSPKGQQLASVGAAAVVFAWLDLHRQVRAAGTVERLADSESDEYFASRPREHQLGAWASPQSLPIADRAELETRFADVSERFDDVVVPRPPHWGGWRLVPERWEFWQGRPHRLHDRFRYTRAHDGQPWLIERLAP